MKKVLKESATPSNLVPFAIPKMEKIDKESAAPSNFVPFAVPKSTSK